MFINIKHLKLRQYYTRKISLTSTARSSPSNRTAQTRENPVGGGKGTKQKRAQQNSDVIYDEDGYIVGLPRVSVEGMPQYQFAMQYKVVSNNQPMTKTNKTLGKFVLSGFIFN